MILDELYKIVVRDIWQGRKGSISALINARSVSSIIGKLSIARIATTDIDGMILRLKTDQNAPATINRKLATLSTALRYAVQRGHLAAMPIIPWQKEPPGRLRWITREEETRLLAMADPHFRDFVIVLLDTGIRTGEAIRIKEGDCQDGWLHIRESKSGKPRSIPLTSRADIALASLPFDLSKMDIQRKWNAIKQAMGLTQDKEFVPHCCRHTFCSRLVQIGTALPVVQQLAGHANITMTMRYSHLQPENLKTAIAAMERTNGITFHPGNTGKIARPLPRQGFLRPRNPMGTGNARNGEGPLLAIIP